MSDQKRPRARTHNGADLLGVTKADCDNYPLLGFEFAFEGVHFTRAQASALRKLYGFRRSEPGPLIEPGDQRSMMRRAVQDGLRMVAWMAKHCEPGEDPVRKLARLVEDAGYDLDPADYAWAVEDENEQSD